MGSKEMKKKMADMEDRGEIIQPKSASVGMSPPPHLSFGISAFFHAAAVPFGVRC